MIEEAEIRGTIHPGDFLIEPTSGNTGIGIALAAAIKGYKAIITMPEKMSQEKVNCLLALGAQVIKTPTEAAFDDHDSHISVAKRLKDEIGKNAFILDQYSNEDNPLAHYYGTGDEIWRQCGGRIDAVVIGAGTGGTISGVGKRLKEYNPSIQIYGVDPIGSLLARPDSLNSKADSYAVEGLGYDFIPKVLDYQYVDEWIKTSDNDSFAMARRLIREEGLLVGGSSGSALWAAVKVVARRFRKDQRVVVILPDSIRNYINKFADDSWMTTHGYQRDSYLEASDEHAFSSAIKYEVEELSPKCKVPINFVKKGTKCIDALHSLRFDWTPVVTEQGMIYCVISKAAVFMRIVKGHGSDVVERAGSKEFACIIENQFNDTGQALGLLCTGRPIFVKTGEQFYLIDPSIAI